MNSCVYVRDIPESNKQKEPGVGPKIFYFKSIPSLWDNLILTSILYRYDQDQQNNLKMSHYILETYWFIDSGVELSIFIWPLLRVIKFHQKDISLKFALASPSLPTDEVAGIYIIFHAFGQFAVGQKFQKISCHLVLRSRNKHLDVAVGRNSTQASCPLARAQSITPLPLSLIKPGS